MLAKRLYELREEKGFTKREIASRLPVHHSTYVNYETGFREPSSDVLRLLARFYDVSLDYLLGASDCRRRKCIESGFECLM